MHKQPCLHIGSPHNGRECPEIGWDGRTGTGCPAWREYKQEQPYGSGNFVLLKKGCCFQLQEFWAFEAVRLLESNYAMTESFRNGMCETGPDDKVRPKTSPVTIAVASMLQQIVNQQQMFLGANENNFLNVIK